MTPSFKSSINYKIHTDAIKENIVLPQKLTLKEGNMRDYADVYQLVCLANLENLNAEFIKMGLSQNDRLIKLNESAIVQMKSLLTNRTVKKLLK